MKAVHKLRTISHLPVELRHQGRNSRGGSPWLHPAAAHPLPCISLGAGFISRWGSWGPAPEPGAPRVFGSERAPLDPCESHTLHMGKIPLYNFRGGKMGKCSQKIYLRREIFHVVFLVWISLWLFCFFFSIPSRRSFLLGDLLLSDPCGTQEGSGRAEDPRVLIGGCPAPLGHPNGEMMGCISCSSSPSGLLD